MLRLGQLQPATAEVEVLTAFGRFGRAEDILVEPVQHKPAAPLRFHQMSVPQDLQVVRDGDHFDVEQFRELTDTFGPGAQLRHNAQPQGLAQRFQLFRAPLGLKGIFGHERATAAEWNGEHPSLVPKF
jgi:hypothetical protein